MELLIIVALLAVLTALAIPTGHSSISTQLSAAAEHVAMDLALTRSLAVLNNSEYHIEFEVPRNRYTIQHTGDNAAFDELPIHATRSQRQATTRYLIELDNLAGLPSGAVRLYAVWQNMAPVTSMEFTGNGSMSPEANQQAEWVTIWLTAGRGVQQRFIDIRVNPVTGLATTGNLQSTAP